jgi:hypothetical protein
MNTTSRTTIALMSLLSVAALIALPIPAGASTSTQQARASRLPATGQNVATAPAECFELRSAGLSAQADPTAPFDGVGVVSMNGGDFIIVRLSVVPTNDLSAGYIETTSHTITFPADPGQPWDGVVVHTDDVVERVPLTPGYPSLHQRHHRC